ncbi:peptide/nickel transport system substrate-binding protein [Pantoea sp. AG1095]|jgi:peptide/nickel transport system substrate-binding protein|uniref:ABC transporter substrate-binding protein n=1 Tax=Pantoea endophytica TaxID=92488 RepID=A0ABX4SSP0_9GAMM|nr:MULTISPECIES: ABC transporter substrate-binding protein [Pantoea]MBY4838933.1 ABC transporter substrate-binding protein [Pantoea sp. DY-5]PLR24681.1 ABC transporter substrate-binding protein [Pantoea endophytica]PYG46758.1 peptide/nickel transport system substrate-binding protein [Pantoea sp. AG1095]
MRSLILLVALWGSSFALHAATPKDTLVVAVPLDGIISFDPAESFETVSNSVQRNIYQTLVEADRHDPQKLAPLLATHWQQGSTPHSLVFNIKPNAHFSSGNPVTAQDVIFSLTRAVQLNKAPSFILAEFGWTNENIASQFKVLNDHQLEIQWPAQIGQNLALRLLTAPVASVVDSKTVQQHVANNDLGNGWLHTHSAGSGAFILQQYVPQQALVLSANQQANPQPKLKRILLKGVADASARRLLIQQGDVDVAYQLGPDQIDALKSDKNLRIEAFPSSLVYYLGFNTKDKAQPALGNPALWQAARWLVDYNTLSKDLLKGQYRIHQSFLPQGFDGALDDQPFHYDVAKAKEILAKGGIKPGTKFALTVINQPPYIDVAQALQASFAKADVQIELQPVAESELWSKMRGRDFQSIFIYWGADYVDPNTNASAFAYNVPGGSKTLAWRVGWDIPDLSAKTRAAAGESDAVKRRALYTDLQKTVQQNSPFVVTLQGAQQVAVRNNVNHVQQGIGVSLLFFDTVQK